MRTPLERKLRASLHSLGVAKTAKLLIAVSGGADSTALADALARLHKGQLALAHFNHLLRGEESDADEEFVRELSTRLGLQMIVGREDIAALARTERRNLEAVARDRRYGFLKRAARAVGATFLATAHTRDDQVETVCMRLIRGSGPEGLRGIHATRALADELTLIRPLLAATRDEVLAHCAQYGLDYRNDSSNLAMDLMRNRVRGELLPHLRSFNPRFDEALLRAAALIAEDDSLLSGKAAKLFVEASRDNRDDRDRLSLLGLPDEHPALRRRVLRMWLRAARGDLRKIGTVHLAAIEALIVEGQSGGRVDLPGDFVVSRQFEDLLLQRVSDLPDITPVPIPLIEGAEVVFGSYRLILLRGLHRREAKEVMDRSGSGGELALLRECDQLGSLHLRTRIEGDTYESEGAERPVKLKKLMIRHRIPLRNRETHPLVVTADNKVLWAPGLPVSRDFIARGQGRCALIIARPASSADAGPDATPDATEASAKASIDSGG